MADFVQTLTRFRSGECSLDEVYAEIDVLLAEGSITAERMLNTLLVVSTFKPISQEIRSSIEEYIQASAGNDEPDRLATSASAQANVAAQPGHQVDQKAVTGTDRNKAVEATGVASPQGNEGSETEASDKLGSIIDQRYELLELIAAGGFSRVYKARDLQKPDDSSAKELVTIHLFKQTYEPGKSWFEQLQQSARKVQNLEHPNIAASYDFNRDGATVYLVQEYLSGQSLGRIFRFTHGQQLSEEEKLCIFNEMGNALHHAHEHGILHGDFTPANVLIGDDGKVKVMNFGIAGALYEYGAENAEKPRLGAETYGVNTPIYFSPERLDGLKPDRSDDVYSLACIGYELLTGEHPFGRVRATRARDAKLEVKRRSGLTEQQWLALSKALAFERRHRTYTAASLLADMSHKDPISRAKTVVRRRSSRTGARWLALWAVVLMAVAGYGMVHFKVLEIPEVSRKFVSLPSTSELRVENNGQGEQTAILRTSPPEPVAPVAVQTETVSPTVTQAPTSTVAQPGASGSQASNENQTTSESALPYTDRGAGKPLILKQSPVLKREGERVVDTLPFSPVPTPAAQQGSEVEVEDGPTTTSKAVPSAAEQEKPANTSVMSETTDSRRDDEVQQQHLDDLEQRARLHMKRQRLTTPTGNNALELYREMLRIRPGYRVAEEGIADIKVQYQEWANIAIKRKDWRAAKNYLSRALELDPDDLILADALQRLQDRR